MKKKTKTTDFPRYLITASNNLTYVDLGIFPTKDKYIYHEAEDAPLSVGVYKTLCGLKIDVFAEGNEELPTSPDGKYRMCARCLKAKYGDDYEYPND